ncbi:MAG TPA: HlyD family efflux transporter periplasmic adaptor subunit [Roseiflexaceae bacterium]
MSTETAPAEPAAPATAPRTRKRIQRRPLLIGLAILIVAGLAAWFGYNYWVDSVTYISTDDALVDADMAAVTTTGSGILDVWRVKPGDRVRAGQVIGLLKPGPSATGAPIAFNITAPIDGTLVRVDGKQGQIVSASQPIAYVADLDHLRVTAFVDETAIHNVVVGKPVDITVDATGSTKYRGRVAEILQSTASQFALIPSTDRSTANFTKVTQRVEIHIALDTMNSQQLFPGENAYVRIHR